MVLWNLLIRFCKFFKDFIGILVNWLMELRAVMLACFGTSLVLDSIAEHPMRSVHIKTPVYLLHVFPFYLARDVGSAICLG